MTYDDGWTAPTVEELRAWRIDAGTHGDHTGMHDCMAVAHNLARRYALPKDRSSAGSMIDLLTGDRVSMSAIDSQSRPYYGYRGPGNRVNPIQEWHDMPEKIVVDGVTCQPGNHALAVMDGDRLMLNTWRPVEIRFEGPDITDEEFQFAAGGFRRYARHMANGSDAETAWFANYFVCNTQFPGERGVALLHGTEQKGTGRDLGMKLLARMRCGDPSTEFKTMLADEITGAKNVGQYIDMRGALFTTVSEVQVPRKDQERAAAFVRTYVNPQVEKRPWNEKSGRKGEADVHTSFWFATNTLWESLPLTWGERRVCVIEGPPSKLEKVPELKEWADALLPPSYAPPEVHAQAQRYLAALHEYLMNEEADLELWNTVLLNDALATVVEGRDGECIKTLRAVLDDLPSERNAIYLDEVVQKVCAKLHVLPSSKEARGYRKVIREALSRQLGEDPADWGVNGWAGWGDRKQRFDPPPGVTFRHGQHGVTIDSAGQHYVLNMVVRAPLKNLAGVDRGLLVAEMKAAPNELAAAMKKVRGRHLSVVPEDDE
jgi:hypothetical protein